VRLLVTDLDNTLYDWVGSFAPSFRAMARELAVLLDVDEARLYREFKSVHCRHHNSEHPFAAFELPSVRRSFPRATPAELLAHLRGPLAAFDRMRIDTLRLYDGVADTLATLGARGVRVVGHTEAIGVTARQRLRLLGIEAHFSRVYCLAAALGPHPSTERVATAGVTLHEVPRAERKPNPDLLRDICIREGVSVDDTVYVGDSLTRDVFMAKQAGVRAVWARYGRSYPEQDWETVVRVSHWTRSDVRREAKLKATAAGVEPDVTIDGFAEVLDLL
jgi:phosphoglycolate phosphatase